MLSTVSLTESDILRALLKPSILHVRERETMSLGNRCGFYSGRDVYRTSAMFHAKGSFKCSNLRRRTLNTSFVESCILYVLSQSLQRVSELGYMLFMCVVAFSMYTSIQECMASRADMERV